MLLLHFKSRKEPLKAGKERSLQTQAATNYSFTYRDSLCSAMCVCASVCVCVWLTARLYPAAILLLSRFNGLTARNSDGKLNDAPAVRHIHSWRESDAKLDLPTLLPRTAPETLNCSIPSNRPACLTCNFWHEMGCRGKQKTKLRKSICRARFPQRNLRVPWGFHRQDFSYEISGLWHFLASLKHTCNGV